MKTIARISLGAFISFSAIIAQAQSYGPQVCQGSLPTGEKVEYRESCGTENGTCYIQVSVGVVDVSLNQYDEGAKKATIAKTVYTGGEITYAVKEAQDLTVILNRSEKSGSLTYVNDQNLILNNFPVKCENDSDI